MIIFPFQHKTIRTGESYDRIFMLPFSHLHLKKENDQEVFINKWWASRFSTLHIANYKATIITPAGRQELNVSK